MALPVPSDRLPRKRPPPTKYKLRERDWEFMGWVKTLPCWWAFLGGCGAPGTLDGVIEADHAGRRGTGRKAHDRTCVPACHLHHMQRDAFSGPFKTWDQTRMREQLQAAIAWTQEQWERRLSIL